jgi:LysR family nitrogen assimilation transcriptional regulator
VKLNELDLNKLHVFRIVAESASMREAGERLLRTPSAVSQSVSSLERALGIPLFVRAGIRLELTDPGRRLLRQVEQGERALQAVLEDVRGRASAVRGRVTIGMPPGYPAVSLPPRLAQSLADHPELQLRFRFLPHAELSRGLGAGELEAALSFQPLGRLDRRIKSARVRDERLVLALHPRLRHHAGAVEGELPIVDYYQKPMLVEGWLKHHRVRKLRPRVRVFASNLDHVLQLVREGTGCAVVPRHVVTHELAAGRLLEHALDRRKPWIVGVWLNWPQPDSRLGAGARVVREALRA